MNITRQYQYQEDKGNHVHTFVLASDSDEVSDGYVLLPRPITRNEFPFPLQVEHVNSVMENVGKVTSATWNDKGELIGEATFDTTELASEMERKYVEGFLKGCSLRASFTSTIDRGTPAFMQCQLEWEERHSKPLNSNINAFIKDYTLQELSLCAVPADSKATFIRISSKVEGNQSNVTTNTTMDNQNISIADLVRSVQTLNSEQIDKRTKELVTIAMSDVTSEIRSVREKMESVARANQAVTNIASENKKGGISRIYQIALPFLIASARSKVIGEDVVKRCAENAGINLDIQRALDPGTTGLGTLGTPPGFAAEGVGVSEEILNLCAREYAWGKFKQIKSNSAVTQIPAIQYAGVAANIGSGATVSPSAPIFSAVAVNRVPIVGVIPIRLDLLNDVAALAGVIADSFIPTFGRAIDYKLIFGSGTTTDAGYAGLLGTGQTAPTGLAVNGGCIGIAKTATVFDAGNGLTFTNLAKAVAGISEAAQSGGNNAWVMSGQAFSSLAGLVDGNGQPVLRNFAADLLATGIGQMIQPRLLGYPVILSEVMGKVSGAATDGRNAIAIFGDINSATVITQGGLQVEYSTQSQFDQYNGVFRGSIVSGSGVSDGSRFAKIGTANP